MNALEARAPRNVLVVAMRTSSLVLHGPCFPPEKTIGLEGPHP